MNYLIKNIETNEILRKVITHGTPHLNDGEVLLKNSIYFKQVFTEKDKKYFIDDSYTLTIQDKSKTKEELLFDINQEFEDSIKSLKNGIPEDEILSWSKQESEARAYQLDNTVSTPLLAKILNKRTKFQSMDELVAKVIIKADLYANAVGEFVGIRQQKEDELEEENE